jgi:hypothetical protein
MCPISTEGWTRRVHFVREGGGGWGGDCARLPSGRGLVGGEVGVRLGVEKGPPPGESSCGGSGSWYTTNTHPARGGRAQAGGPGGWLPTWFFAHEVCTVREMLQLGATSRLTAVGALGFGLAEWEGRGVSA